MDRLQGTAMRLLWHLRFHSNLVRPFWFKYCRNSSSGTVSSRPKKGQRPSVYDCEFVESHWYEWWENTGHFTHPSTSSRQEQSFSVCLPPPNITGDLHIGHALTATIEDVIIRWRRMMGDSVVWIPGYDHAGIATQVVVEKQLMRERGLRRVDMPREEFIAECFRWKQAKMGNIEKQLKRLGASLHWDRTYYTMDQNFSNAVTEAFLQLHSHGLIFRAEKLVNWCPFLKSTVSDIEVNKTTFNCDNDKESKLTLPGRQHPVPIGRLYYIKYPLVDCVDQFLTVATTRPETIPADVALAVNPTDQRYGKYIGRYVRNPILPNAPTIVIIGDEQVDPNFGTGVLKVTPAHDWTDFEIGLRHGLPLNVQCLTEDGKLNAICGAELANLDRFAARDRITQILTYAGLLVDVKQQSQITLPLCSRTGDVIEPMLKRQWFLNCRQMAANAIRALDEGQLEIKPKFFQSQWRHWLSLTGDWCLSRQLWWGHRIPAYYIKATDTWYCGKTVNEAYELARRNHPNADITLQDLKQDEDVLDTWFSSSLVPMVSAGWPIKEKFDTSALYPLSLMQTGHDILSFWVTRMAMMGLELTGRLPFKNILLHGIVFDKHGRKMSKSLGNVVDPLDIINGVQLETLQDRLDQSSFGREEIERAKRVMVKEFPQGMPACGADALRFMLLKQDVVCETLNVDSNLILSGRKFCNKLWQTFNYMENFWAACSEDGWNCGCGYVNLVKLDDKDMSIMDKWILIRLMKTVEIVNSSLESHQFHFATIQLYDFAWFELCDIYLEWTKFFLRPMNDEHGMDEDIRRKRIIIGDILYLVADTYARCLAPFMPFLAEELYGRLMDIRRYYGNIEIQQAPESVHLCEFPQIRQQSFTNDELENQMMVCKKIWDASRSLRMDFGLPFREQMIGALFGQASALTAAKTFSDFIRIVGKLSIKDYRPLDGDMADFGASYVWKSVDENLLLAIEVQETNQEAVSERLAVQIDRLIKRKRNHERGREKAERILTSEVKSRRNHTEIQEEMENLKRKIENTEVELNRLQRMYGRLRK